MRRPFDQLGKKVGKEALERSGRTVVQYEISRDAQYADLWHTPDPARASERTRLGLLGRMASVLSLFELYAHAPTGMELRACLSKHFAYWQACFDRNRSIRRRTAGAPDPSPSRDEDPFLWILAATFRAPILAKLRAVPSPGWPAGVYAFGGDVLRVGIVVASELPHTRSTLLVRIMAAGPLLPRAVAELGALPPDAEERTVAEGGLVHLHQVLARVSSRTPEEEEFVVSMQSTWEKARKEGRMEGWKAGRTKGRSEGRREGRLKGRVEGRAEGRTEGEARALLTVLRGRGLAVPAATRSRILAEKDPARLELWIKRALSATSLAEVLGEPN